MSTGALESPRRLVRQDVTAGFRSGAAELDAMKQDCDDRYLALCKSALEDRAGRPPNPIALVGFLLMGRGNKRT